jgi:hypothetical protein
MYIKNPKQICNRGSITQEELVTTRNNSKIYLELYCQGYDTPGISGH